MLPAAAGDPTVAREKKKGAARLEAEQLRRDLADAWETVRDLAAALSLALDENARLRRLVPLEAPRPPRPPAVRIRRR